MNTGTMLDRAREAAGLTIRELWARYFALGGMRSAFELDAFLHDALRATDHDHDVIAHAINERSSELGRNNPVSYSDAR